MQQTEAGVRQLKSNLSAFLNRVKAGGTVVITERGRPIGRIVPMAESVEGRMEHLSQAGMVAWSGQTLKPLTPVGRNVDSRTVADLLLGDRA